MQEDTLGKTQQKKFSELYSYEQLENIASKTLNKNGLVRPNAEEVGTMIYWILKAESIYKPEIGKLQPFIHMYMKFAVKKIFEKRKREKKRREVEFSELDIHKSSDRPRIYVSDNYHTGRHDEILDLIKKRNLLSEVQYDVIYRSLVLNEKIPDIAKSYDVSRQRIYAVRDEAIKKIQCLKSELF